MLAIAVCFLLGILFCLQFTELPPQLIFCLLPLVLWLLTRCRSLRFLAVFLLGFFWAVFSAYQADKDRLKPILEGKTLYLCGLVSSLPVRQVNRTRFELSVSSAKLYGSYLKIFPNQIRLNWYRPKVHIKAGQTLCAYARLKRPYGFMNPGGFDYESWLYQRGIRAVGYVLAREAEVKKDAGSFNEYHAIRGKIQQHLDKQKVSPLIHALVLGDRSRMSSADWQVLQKTGTGHLLAISGLHIGLIATFGFFLGRWFWSMTLLHFTKFPAQYVGAIIALMMATLYAALAGFSLPTQRAVLMLVVVLFAILSQRRFSSMNVFGIALLTVLIYDPFAPLSYSFWLSFTAVLIILLINIDRANRSTPLRTWFRLQYYISFGLLPVLLILFGQIPSLSLFANLFAIPLLSTVTVPTALSGTVLSLLDIAIAEYFLTICNYSIDLFWLIMARLSEVSLAQIQLPDLPVYVKTCVVMAAVVLLAPRGVFAPCLLVFLLLPILVYRPIRPSLNEAIITVFDVGQGLAVLVETQTHTLLYDTGPAFSDSFNTGKAVILPYLRYRGIQHLDVLVQSHGDLDHIGGLEDILNAISVDEIYSSVPERLPPGYASHCHAGQQWHWGGVIFSILHPAQIGEFSGNNASCVLAISNSITRVLIPGDIEKAAEQQLLARQYSKLDTDILLVPHHGSYTSSSQSFIEATSPRIAVFPVGYRNRFKLPKQDIIARYKDSGAILLYTYASGALTFSIAGAEIKWSQHRQIQRRFWHTTTTP